jgi:hypothetical protein
MFNRKERGLFCRNLNCSAYQVLTRADQIVDDGPMEKETDFCDSSCCRCTHQYRMGWEMRGRQQLT